MFRVIRGPMLNQEGGMGGGGEAAPVTSQPASATSNSGGESFQGGTPRWGMPQQAVPNQAAPVNPLLADVPATPVAPAAETIDFAGRKVQVNDPAMLTVLKDIQKDYTSLQGTYTQTSQRMKDLETERNTLMQLVQNFQQNQMQAQPPQAQTQQAPVDMEQVKEQFMEKFYDDPMGAITELLEKQFEQKVKPVVEPIAAERQWNEQVQKLSTKFEDFKDMVGPMQQVLQEMPHLAQQGLEMVYYVAKGRNAQAAPTPEQLMSDPNFIQQHVMNNQHIQQQIVSQYLNQRQSTNQQTPPVMGNQPGGQPPAMPPNAVKSLSEGTKAFRQWLNGL